MSRPTWCLCRQSDDKFSLPTGLANVPHRKQLPLPTPGEAACPRLSLRSAGLPPVSPAAAVQSPLLTPLRFLSLSEKMLHSSVLRPLCFCLHIHATDEYIRFHSFKSHLHGDELHKFLTPARPSPLNFRITPVTTALECCSDA